MGMDSGKGVDIIPNVINVCSKCLSNHMAASSAAAKANVPLLGPWFSTPQSSSSVSCHEKFSLEIFSFETCLHKAIIVSTMLDVTQLSATSDSV